MNYYCLIDHRKNCKEVFVSTEMDLHSVKDLIFYIQAKVHLDISENLFLTNEDVANLLTEHFNFERQFVVDLDRGIDVIDFIHLWNDNVDRLDSIVAEIKLKNSLHVEKSLIKLLDNYQEKFLFINVAALLPKWAEEMYIPPLTLDVTNGGVLINGLDVVTEEVREKIHAFYPQSTFLDKDQLFFHFNEFPLTQYSFSWDGRRISVKEIKEIDQYTTEIVKEMNIGYFLSNGDFRFPIKNLKEFQQLKRKMRLS